MEGRRARDGILTLPWAPGAAQPKILPQVLCIEHGHHGVDGTTSMLAPLGYAYDFSSFNNSFYHLAV